MENENKEKIKQDSPLADAEPIFLKKSLLNTSNNEQRPHKRKLRSLEIDRNHILDVIREVAPISISDLQRKLGISYGTLWNIVRELKFVRLIEIKDFEDEKNNFFKIIHIPKIKPKENKNE